MGRQGTYQTSSNITPGFRRNGRRVSASGIIEFRAELFIYQLYKINDLPDKVFLVMINYL